MADIAKEPVPLLQEIQANEASGATPCHEVVLVTEGLDTGREVLVAAKTSGWLIKMGTGTGGAVGMARVVTMPEEEEAGLVAGTLNGYSEKVLAW